MRRLVVMGLCLGLLEAQALKVKVKEESFITILEYGKELYKNPRDISCARCHGPLGEEKIITHYTQHGKERIFKAPPIYDLSFERFKNALERGKSIMPRYNLTLDEIKAIYYYITSIRSNKQN
ncbi:c-type cytochrome [Helicobacter felis]|uniref:Periplasmic protein n=1 Tax=Helicobacter felis (strain ATCC 49179 / CCUG 28539 / NCTC 12436 / CS1) TaxID=936155 RepID=E7AD46_HELFC|nr:cytochrome c [Helicobacter felis]CBY82311.1 putative periplasmic protein [Helicobacter felis ATCC 49179]